MDIEYNIKYSNAMITPAQIRMTVALTGVKTADLSRMCGVSRGTLSNLMSLDSKACDENKRPASPNLRTLEKVRDGVSKFLEVSDWKITDTGGIEPITNK